jgi:hypothetical protein
MRSFRILLATLLLALFAAPAFAQDATTPEAPWQDVITGQIQAFRDSDAPTAFSFAGAGFQTTFPSAEVFFQAIITSGYAPIMESSSHSFGPFQMVSPAAVTQRVDFIGKSQERYTAVYQMTEEPAGWRVQGVQLVKEAGIAI